MRLHGASSVRVVVCAVVAALASGAVGISHALAEVPAMYQEPPSITVRYADLNLASEEGARTLYQRLVAAAEQVCPYEADTVLAMRQHSDARRCIAEAVERAVEQINSPQLARLFASRMR